MSGAPIPPELLAIIASSAAGAYITNPMPLAPTGTNAASVQGGFPAITMQPEVGGGEPPLGQDANGFFYLLSAHIFALQAGQGYQFDADVAAAISGYAVGAILAMEDGNGYWLNGNAGNTSNPDTGGAGWAPLIANGVGALTGLTGGSVTPNRGTIAKFPVITLSGTLTSNLVIILPAYGEAAWLIVNNTTGAFTTTVKTAASGSSGTVIPQGGPTQPTGVYSIGDGNIYPSYSPLTVPIAQAATPLTLSERTSAGYLLATYFNQSSGLESPAIGSVFVQNTAADGYLRKVSNANFISGLSLATQAYATGAAAVVFGATANNTAQLPGGFYLKWGTVAQTVAANQSHSFPVAFPNNCLNVIAVVADSTGVEFSGVVNADTNKSAFTFYANNTCNVNYWAVGN